MAIYSGTNLESETARESATKNQKLKPANQKPKKRIWTKSATPSEHFVEWDIMANLSS